MNIQRLPLAATSELNFRNKIYTVGTTAAGGVSCELKNGNLFDKIVEFFQQCFGRPSDMVQKLNDWGAKREEMQLRLDHTVDGFERLQQQMYGCENLKPTKTFLDLFDSVQNQMFDPKLRQMGDHQETLIMNLNYSINKLCDYLAFLGAYSRNYNERDSHLLSIATNLHPNILCTGVLDDQKSIQELVDILWEKENSNLNFDSSLVADGYHMPVDVTNMSNVSSHLRGHITASTSEFSKNFCKEIIGAPGSELHKCTQSLCLRELNGKGKPRDTDLLKELKSSAISAKDVYLGGEHSLGNIEDALNCHLAKISDIKKVIDCRNHSAEISSPNYHTCRRDNNVFQKLRLGDVYYNRDRDLLEKLEKSASLLRDRVNDDSKDARGLLEAYEQAFAAYKKTEKEVGICVETRNIHLDIAKEIYNIHNDLVNLINSDKDICAIWKAATRNINHNDETIKEPLVTPLSQESVNKIIMVAGVYKKMGDGFLPVLQDDMGIDKSQKVLEQVKKYGSDILDAITSTKKGKKINDHTAILYSQNTLMEDKSNKDFFITINKALELMGLNKVESSLVIAG